MSFRSHPMPVPSRPCSGSMIKDRADSTKFSQVASELIASGHGFRFHAKGRSMLPVIQDGEFLHVAQVDVDDLKLADIVLFQRGENLKAHRIVRKHGRLFTT